MVITSGGLGPTADDLTRQAVAEALGRGLEEKAQIVADIEAMLMIFPSVGCCRSICWASAWAQRYSPVRFTAITLSHSSRLILLRES